MTLIKYRLNFQSFSKDIKKEIAFYGKEITADNLRQCTQTSTVIDELDEYDFIDNTYKDSESPDYTLRSTSLDINYQEIIILNPTLSSNTMFLP